MQELVYHLLLDLRINIPDVTVLAEFFFIFQLKPFILNVDY